MAKGGDLHVLLGALVGVVAGGLLILTALPALVPVGQVRPVPAPPPAPVVVVDPEPEAEASLEAAPAPRFDTVRVAPDGSGLVAGQAVPGAAVAVLAGEEVAAEVTADADGRFVAFLNLPPSTEPRALSLRDEAGTPSEETVIVAPTGGLVAEASDVPGVAAEGASTEVAGEASEAVPATGETQPPSTGVAGADVESRAPEDSVVATRDLPSDRPTPSLSPTGEAGPSPLGTGEAPPASAPAEATEGGGPGTAPGAGTEVASAEPGTAGPATGDSGEAATGPREAAGPAPAESDAASAPEVAAVAPSEAEVPSGEGGAPGAVTSPEAEASSIAVAVAGPSAASPDLPPERRRAPEVGEGPGGRPAPEGGAPGQAAVLLSDAEGVRVLQPALAPGADAEVLSTVALDAISYGGEGEVLLTGRASGGGAVRLYLDNAPVAEVPVGADGQWSATLPGTEPGDYRLRVDQIDASGEVVSRIETPFRREARSELAAAMAEAQRPGQTIAVRTVQPGNTLWAIARDRYGQGMMYVQVFEMNRARIRDPDLIYPGQVFVLPATEGR